jgi:hypothetical protein
MIKPSFHRKFRGKKSLPHSIKDRGSQDISHVADHVDRLVVAAANPSEEDAIIVQRSTIEERKEIRSSLKDIIKRHSRLSAV